MDEHAAPIIFTTDANGRVSSWNPPAEALFGYSAAAIVGAPVTTLFPDETGPIRDRLPLATVNYIDVADDRWCLRHDGTRFRGRHAAVTLCDAASLIGFVRILHPIEPLTDDDRGEPATAQAWTNEQQRELAATSASLRVERAERRYSEEARLRLLRRLVIAQEQERRRIARDLHDHLGQQLTSLRLKVGAARHLAGGSAAVDTAFEEIESMLQHVDRDIDFLSWELRPAALDDLGLAPVLDHYVREWAHHAHVPAQFHAEGVTDERIAPEVEATLYRIAQEALNNVAKHAQARAVSVLLERQGRNLSLVVEDNGVGIDMARRSATHIGLHSMRERAAVVGGTLEIEPTAGGGTTVHARVPLWLADVGETLAGDPDNAGGSGRSMGFDASESDEGISLHRLHELQRAVDRRDEFIATVAHELRNPIAPLMFQVRLAIDRTEQSAKAGAAVTVEWTQSQLRRIEHRLHRLLETLDRLLDVSRLATGRIDLALEEVDLVDVVQDVLSSFEAELAVARCPVRLTAPSTVTGWWDRLRLDQMSRNLVSNAIRFGAGQPIDVIVAADDGTATLTIRDQGIGISKEKQEMIFQRFERGPDATRSGGFGVGLWVVKTVCAAMGGTIDVESTVGTGATFTVTLPRRSERELASGR